MHPLSATTMLDVWERERAQSPSRRALALLSAACPDSSYEELAALPVGERDARLLALREWAFGLQMRGVANCPACSETLELSLPTDRMRAAAPTQTDFVVCFGGEEFHARVPTTRDLLAVEAMPDADAARAVLLERCVGGRSLAELPDGAVSAIVTQMAHCDPRANIELALECPACRHEWLALLNVVSFFWKEIEAWSRRTLAEVHALASAYGWTEAEILALSPWRRQVYLEMLSIA
ncbi:MAG TPA: hypothetical protein VE713_02185 [Pyrinomonadaceae bacterium]|nr:hypothetical protein [Pyrinomonadaceae bacterium]